MLFVEILKKVCSSLLRREQAFFMPLLIESFGVDRVRDSILYISALTHGSFHGEQTYRHESLQLLNERLEFLGDAVLELVVSDYLCARFPNMAEGKLTRLRASIVCRDNLNALGRSIGLKKYIRTGSPMPQIGVDVLGNVYEALIGAIYLEKGYGTVCKLFVERVLESGFIDWGVLQGELYDYRSMVLHWSQREKKKVEYIYEELSQKPSLFQCRLIVDGDEKLSGCGRTKKLATQEVCKLWVQELKMAMDGNGV